MHKFHAATWNLLANKAGAELLNNNMRQIGAPKFTDADHALAKAVRKSLGKPDVGMPTDRTPLAPPAASYTGGLATDTADISWQAPTAVLLSAAYPPGIPNHKWGVTATAATNIGHQATLSAARYLAAGAIDLIEQPNQMDAMKQEFQDRTAGIEWASMIPDDNQPPLYEPPADFLKATGQSWPPTGDDLAVAAGGGDRATGHHGGELVAPDLNDLRRLPCGPQMTRRHLPLPGVPSTVN
ncbi:hypothetical protein ABZS88_37060 [Streptomyces sp. NPDC005480]|uniref:hypothetical protein n=1 Tax=Streptomyces sp. NPDC005480 TaxID=3154880 RepID=UPI0033B2FCB1